MKRIINFFTGDPYETGFGLLFWIAWALVAMIALGNWLSK